MMIIWKYFTAIWIHIWVLFLKKETYIDDYVIV